MPEAEQPAAQGGKTEEGEVKESASKNGPPPGVVPLFFSGPSQQIFGCVVDVDLTAENPHKLIPKEKIVEDFRNRAAVCDFHPVKQKMLDYPGDEVLLVYDHDFKYGENFYVCVTEEAKELLLNPPVTEEGAGEGEEKKEEEVFEIPKTPEPKEWVCLGSDLEVLEMHVHTFRPLAQYSISRKRRHFGAPVTLSDSGQVETVDIELEEAGEGEKSGRVVKMEMEVGVQAVEETKEVACQTERRLPCNAATQYVPRDMTESEVQTVMEGEEMTEFLDRVCPRLEICLQQNQILDLFVDDCKALSDHDWVTGSKSDTHLKEYQSFTDLKFSKDKVINWIEWHPTIKGVIAVACGESYDADERIDLSSRLVGSQSLILLWSFADPIHPQLFLEAPEDILCFKFNPSDPNIVAGGCINGQVILWDLTPYQDRLQINKATDTTEGRSLADNLTIFDTDPKLDHAPILPPVALSSIEHGHSLAACDLHWIPDHIEICLKTTHVLENVSHFSRQLVTCSIDGSVMFWDTRPPLVKKKSVPASSQKSSTNPLSHLDLTWKPFNKIPLPRAELPKTYSATRVSLKEKQRERGKGKEEDGGGEVGGGGGGGVKGNDGSSDQLPPIVNSTGAGEGDTIEGASTKYFLGSEDGEVVWGDWTPSRDPESGKFIPSRPDLFFYSHSGQISCVERSPFFRDVILTVGGWNWAVWREGNKNGALLTSCSSTVPYTGGAWSPSRPGVFFVCKRNGNLEVWDLLDRSHEPSLTQNISSLPITAISPFPITSHQVMVAAGDSAGTLHILEVPWTLSYASTNEAAIMEAFFDQETRRAEFSSERAEMRARERKEEEAAAASEAKDEKAVDLESQEDKAKKEYEEYLAMENRLLIELGVVEPLPEQQTD